MRCCAEPHFGAQVKSFKSGWLRSRKRAPIHVAVELCDSEMVRARGEGPGGGGSRREGSNAGEGLGVAWSLLGPEDRSEIVKQSHLEYSST